MLRSVSLLALAAAALSAQANLVANGGFETGDFTGWTQGGNLGHRHIETDAPHSGTFHASLGPTDSVGTMSQSIATVVGTSYTVSFYLRDEDLDTDPSSLFNASFAGVVGSTPSVNAPTLTYQFYSFNVTATSANSLLEFSIRNDPSHYYLDDVSVTANVSSVPGPAAALPFALLALKRRKRA